MSAKMPRDHQHVQNWNGWSLSKRWGRMWFSWLFSGENSSWSKRKILLGQTALNPRVENLIVLKLYLNCSCVVCLRLTLIVLFFPLASEPHLAFGVQTNSVSSHFWVKAMLIFFLFKTNWQFKGLFESRNSVRWALRVSTWVFKMDAGQPVSAIRIYFLLCYSGCN